MKQRQIHLLLGKYRKAIADGIMKAADEFKGKTTAPNQLWQTDFTYLKVTGWGRPSKGADREGFGPTAKFCYDPAIGPDAEASATEGTTPFDGWQFASEKIFWVAR